MKSWILILMFSSITTVAIAQAPAHTQPTKPRLTLTSDGFEDGGPIPNKFSADAQGTPVSPKLTWTYAPEGTVSYALILRDPDNSVMHTAEETLHWLVFNIPGTAHELAESSSAQAQLPDGSVQGLNQQKKVGYMPLAAAAVGPYHHYTFELFALDTKLASVADAPLADVLKAMDGHILMKAVLVGRFHRP